MQLQQFLSEILPDTGVKFLVLDAKHHVAYATIEDLADAALVADDQERAVYFACASYKEVSYIDKDGKKRQRTQENVQAIKAFWLDIDCREGKDYATTREALAALRDLTTSTGFPSPILVGSGGGIHCYWPISEAITPEEWHAQARLFRAFFESNDLKFDHSRDCDSASILRVPGTHNRKYDTPKQVKIAPNGYTGPYDLATLADIAARHTPLGSLPSTPAYLAAAINSDLALPEREYPPLDVEIVVKQCRQMKAFKETGGGSYNAWRAAIGVLKFVENGDKLAHEWGSQHPDYVYAETQAKFDDWNTPPPTCAAFGDDCGHCTACPHFGKVNSPASLAIGGNVVEVFVPEEKGLHDEITSIVLPDGYALNELRQLCRFVKDDETGAWVTTPFCDTFLYPVARVQDTAGMMSTKWIAEYAFKNKTATRPVIVPGQTLGERGSALHGLLAKHEIAVKGNDRRYLEDYMAAFMTKMRAEREAVKQYKTFGWQEHERGGMEGFLLGSTLYTPTGDKQVVLSGTNTGLFADAFIPHHDADKEKWVECIDKMYNHPGHEQFQFILYAGFGSALVHFFGEPTGAPISLYGGRGQGKTTACKMALSIYGKPNRLMVSWKTGATLNAVLKSCAIMGSVPFLIDEFSNAFGAELSDALYAMGNGRDKMRSDTAGNLKMDGLTWALTTFATTNSSLHDKVSVLKDDATAEISRLLELHWDAADTISHHTMLRLQEEIEPHYGSVGREYIQYIVENYTTVKAMIQKVRERLDKMIGFTKETRFWSLQIAAAMVGGYIATKLGFLKFDYKAVDAYAVALGKTHLRQIGTHVTDASASFSNMITSMSNQIIVTWEEGDGRSSMMEVPRVIGSPVGRLIQRKNVLYLSTSAVRDWCKEKHVGYEEMHAKLVSEHIILKEGFKYYLGKGTNIPTGQVNCWKLNWSIISGTVGAVFPEVEAPDGRGKRGAVK